MIIIISGIILFVLVLDDFVDDTPKGRVIIKGVFCLIGIVLIGLFTNFIIKTM